MWEIYYIYGLSHLCHCLLLGKHKDVSLNEEKIYNNRHTYCHAIKLDERPFSRDWPPRGQRSSFIHVYIVFISRRKEGVYTSYRVRRIARSCSIRVRMKLCSRVCSTTNRTACIVYTFSVIPPSPPLLLPPFSTFRDPRVSSTFSILLRLSRTTPTFCSIFLVSDRHEAESANT